MIDPASIDRAVATLLELAEDKEALTSHRIEAAQSVLELAEDSFGPDDSDLTAIEVAARNGFEAGARWRQRHPFARVTAEALAL